MIGDIIKKQRILIDMTRKELSEDICTEKYIYLIESNERNPSAYILNSLSERLGIDLIEYYQFLNYENKDMVAFYKESFERHIQRGDIESLKKESLKAAELEDFKREPLIYDIIVIDLVYRSLVKGETTRTIEKLNEILKTEKLNIDNLTLINAYITLSSCYQLEGRLKEAEEVVRIAYDMVRDKKEFSRYKTATITVLISLVSLLYNLEEYQELISYGKDLKSFQEDYSSYNRIYYVDFYLAVAYYKKGKLDLAKEHFERGIHSALLFKSRVDMGYISEIEEFGEMAEALKINQYLIDQFYQVLNSED